MNKIIRSEQGFTLIELIIVILLIGLTAALVLPKSLNKGISSAAVKSEASKLAGAIRLARQKAVTTGSAYCVDFTPNSYTIYPAEAGLSSGSSEYVDEHILIEPNLGADTLVEFGPSGSPAQTGHIVLVEKSSGQPLVKLQIYSEGNVDIQILQH